MLPIKDGFVKDITDTRTYATRLVTAVKVLDALRVSAREVQRVTTLVDSVDAISSIHSFSFCPLPNAVLLSVTFDKPWEPYIRIIWRELGPLLDLALCNCAGYDIPALEQGFEPFVAWIRERQVKSEFFYALGNLTLADQRYLKSAERMVREGRPGVDAALASLTVVDPKEESRLAGQQHPQDAVRQYGAVLSVMFGLRELYKGKDVGFLAGAARLLLRGMQPPLVQALRTVMPEKVQWFESLPTPGLSHPSVPPRPLPSTNEFQGGIIKPYGGTKHGCLLLLRIVDPIGTRSFLRSLPVTHEGVRTGNEPVAINVAFTSGGLQRLGVSEEDLNSFPSEFREGMEARAGLLGDVRDNHPESWVLPSWNGPNAPPQGASRVALSSVDIVITVRARDQATAGSTHEWSPSHPLFDTVRAIADRPGIELLAVEPMLHYRDGGGLVREHFGFVDGVSQPHVQGFDTPATKHLASASPRDIVPLGDLLVGHTNSHGDPSFPTSLVWPDPRFLLDNGSFLVVRKLRQHVDRLDDVLAGARLVGTPEALLSKFVGRTLDGDPIVSTAPPRVAGGPPTNDFNYGGDTTGAECPFQAHIRRGNPRTPLADGSPMPRIARRSMSYGPQVDRAQNGDSRDRGTIFMAYCASIGEQFEVIQRWMAGGNSTGIFSGHADPLLRVPEPGDSSPMRVRSGQTTAAIPLGDKPLVTLQWGLYLFAPSMAALKALAKTPRTATVKPLPRPVLLPGLRTLEQWQGVLEDLGASRQGLTARVLAEIQDAGQGIFRTGTDYGVVVTDPVLAQTVLTDDTRFSVTEYGQRMKQSVGQTYLGLDNASGHASLSLQPNAVVNAVTRDEAFALASSVVGEMLNKTLAAQGSPATVRLDELVDKALAAMSRTWFGVPDGVFVKAGGNADDAQDVRLPSHSVAPSRYIFSSPVPLSGVTARGQSFGQALTDNVLAYIQSQSSSLPGLSLQLSKISSSEQDLARTIVGMLEGFLPPVWGNVIRTLNQWLTDGTLWRVQQDVLRAANGGAVGADVASSAIEPELRRAMQRAPVPEMIYRTATRDTTLGDFPIMAGERVVVSIRGATMTQLQSGVERVDLVFGGEYHAGGPVHACPARAMGMGAMLGILAAILSRTPIQKTPATLVVRLG